jgi:hypothetical protein
MTTKVCTKSEGIYGEGSLFFYNRDTVVCTNVRQTIANFIVTQLLQQHVAIDCHTFCWSSKYFTQLHFLYKKII